ncbi:MAG: DUF2256 and DUF3253 domain-containing protein [Acidimicrobiia bacterium]|nr:DUF2256 and DUF3253 domain-containing protein [Acidimicrobiia bacterium]
MTALAEKTCASCGRRFRWRKKWERNWDNVRFCSDKCRRRKVTPSDRALEAAILDLLSQRHRGATICPSEAAKAVGDGDESTWRPLMEPARAAARRLVEQDKVVITQHGAIVDPSTAKGPIRIRAV